MSGMGPMADRVGLSWQQREALVSARRIQCIPEKVLARRLGVAPRTLRSWQIGERRPTKLQLACWWREVMGQHLFSGAVENEPASGNAGVVGGFLQQNGSSVQRGAMGLREADGQDLAPQLPAIPGQTDRSLAPVGDNGDAVADDPAEDRAILRSIARHVAAAPARR